MKTDLTSCTRCIYYINGGLCGYFTTNRSMEDAPEYPPWASGLIREIYESDAYECSVYTTIREEVAYEKEERQQRLR